MDNDEKERYSIIRSGTADDKALPASSRNKITKGLANINESNISKALTSLFTKVEIGADVTKHLERGKVYLAEIPKKLQPDFDEGNLQFLTIKETGEQVTEIVGPNNFGTRGHMIVRDADWIHSNIPRDFTVVAMQQQLAQMAAVLDEVRSRIVELQSTYDESLLGELRGMRDQLAQVQSVQDLESQKGLVIDAITQTNLTRGKITQRLIAEMQKMPDVPAQAWRRFFRVLWKEGFRSNVVTGYNKIQELFGYYLAASELLAYAYAFLGEQQAYEVIFFPDAELMKKNALVNLFRSEDILGIEDDERWYKNPQKFLGLIQEEAHRIFGTTTENIEIEVTGEMLLEAMENGREEEKQEG